MMLIWSGRSSHNMDCMTIPSVMLYSYERAILTNWKISISSLEKSGSCRPIFPSPLYLDVGSGLRLLDSANTVEALRMTD